MRLRRLVWLFGGSIVFLGGLWAFQKPFRQYEGIEYHEFELPPDYQEKTEWVFARMMFPPGENNGYRGRDREWHEGVSLWTQDYPRADRHFSLAVKRLTRIHVRSAEQPVNLEDGDEVYYWPWIYAVQVGEWGLTDHQAKILRDYLLRGGFFMADDFHGSLEWEVFAESMRKVFPDRPIVEIPTKDAIFHTVYDLNDRYQIPGYAHLGLGYKNDGRGAQWKAIYDDDGRIMVAASFNSDIGDSWEWADDPTYPAKFSDLGIRIGVNYIVYAMTH